MSVAVVLDRSARTPAGRRGLGVLGVLMALAVWEVVPLVGLVPAEFVPGAVAVLTELVRGASSGAFWAATAATVAGAGLGLVLATVIGVALGAAMGANRWIDHVLRPVVEFLRPVPGVALIPVVVLMVGPGVTGDVILVTFGCMWILLVQTLYGVGAVDRAALETARSYGLITSQRLWWVQLPSALPYVATGLRIAASVALIIAVTTELIAGNPGLGHAITLAQTGGRIAQMYALIAATGILGILVHLGFGALERRLLHWHQSHRAEVS